MRTYRGLDVYYLVLALAAWRCRFESCRQHQSSFFAVFLFELRHERKRGGPSPYGGSAVDRALKIRGVLRGGRPPLSYAASGVRHSCVNHGMSAGGSIPPCRTTSPGMGWLCHYSFRAGRGMSRRPVRRESPTRLAAGAPFP